MLFDAKPRRLLFERHFQLTPPDNYENDPGISLEYGRQSIKQVSMSFDRIQASNRPDHRRTCRKYQLCSAGLRTGVAINNRRLYPIIDHLQSRLRNTDPLRNKSL